MKEKNWQMIPFSFSHLSTQPALQCRWTVCQFLARSPLWSGVRPPRQEFTTLLPNIENNPSSLFHLFAKLFCNPSSPPQSSIRAAFRQVSKHHQQLLSKVRNQNYGSANFLRIFNNNVFDKKRWIFAFVLLVLFWRDFPKSKVSCKGAKIMFVHSK